MSLFSVREIWSLDLNAPDLFDGNLILIVDFDSTSLIFLGSHDGYLRCYAPNISGYKPTDLVYETLFDSPVLQLQMACLVSGSQQKQLAVLHPRSIGVYHIQKVEGDHGAAISLKHAYQHSLHRAAHSFETGSFGNVKGRDFICVQSLDGLFTFFEQESSTFEAQIPDILLPGPFCYLSTIDSFLIQDANLYLVCYTYENLSDIGKKQLSSYWTHNIGEIILNIFCLNFSESGLNIVVLTERNLYNFNDKGGIIWMQGFEFRPICSYSYINSSTYKIMTLLITEYANLHIYEETCLKWSAKLDFSPIYVAIANLTNIRGATTLLTDSGQLSCSYLGTIPSLYLIPPTTEPEIDIHQAETELKNYEAEIIKNDFVGNVEDDILSVNLIVDKKIIFNGDRNIGKVFIELLPQVPINKVQIIFNVEYPLKAAQPSTVLASVCNKETVETYIYLAENGAVSNLEIKVLVSYVSTNGVPRVVQKTDQIPFEVAITTCPPTKDAAIKLVLASNKPTCALNELFPGSDGSANAVGIHFLNSGATTSIIAAKTSQRYRLQAENLEDLTLVLDELVKRVKYQFRRISDFSLTFGSPIPLQIYFDNIEKHYELITRKRLKQEQLAQRSTQYRTVQKKILISLKDLTPKPTSALHKVLNDTYNMIKTAIDELQEIEKEIRLSQCRIASISRLIMNILELMTVKKSDLEDLRLAFSPIMTDNDEQGWLETQNATLTLLLRTTFAKSNKDRNRPTDLTLDPLSDVSRLCKNFATLIDRATKGTNLLERSEFDNEMDSLPTVPSVKKWEQKEMILIPSGSKMVDLSAVQGNKPQISIKMNETNELLGVEKSPLVPVQAEVTIEIKKGVDREIVSEDTEEDLVIPTTKTAISKQETEVKAHTTKSNDNINKTVHGKGIEDDDMWDIDLDEMRI